MDRSEEYIKLIIVHPKVHFSFCFVYVMYLNIASHSYGKPIKSNYVACVGDFHLRTLESTRSAGERYQDSLDQP